MCLCTATIFFRNMDYQQDDCDDNDDNPDGTESLNKYCLFGMAEGNLCQEKKEKPSPRHGFCPMTKYANDNMGARGMLTQVLLS